MSKNEIRERNARLMKFVTENLDCDGEQLGTDGTNLYLLGGQDGMKRVSFEEALAWTLDSLLQKVMNEEVVSVGPVFLVTRKYARRWGFAMPDELEQDVDAKFVLVDDPDRVLLSGRHMELLSELMKRNVEVY